MRPILILAILLARWSASVACAQEPNQRDQPKEAKPDASLDEMRGLAQRTRMEVFAFQQDEKREARLHESPLFRYSDEPRFIKDSTLWIWTERGRLVAIQKIENSFYSPTSPTWTYCFASLSEEFVRAAWPNVPAFETTKPGVVFAPVPVAPNPGKEKTAWDRQFREISRHFSGKSFYELDKFEETFRLLPRPLYEYEAKDFGILSGKIFGLASGTNSSAFLVVELRQAKDHPPQWQFAAVQMTNAGVAVFHDDKKVWTAGPQLRPGQFGNWTYMFLPK